MSNYSENKSEYFTSLQGIDLPFPMNVKELGLFVGLVGVITFVSISLGFWAVEATGFESSWMRILLFVSPFILANLGLRVAFSSTRGKEYLAKRQNREETELN